MPNYFGSSGKSKVFTFAASDLSLKSCSRHRDRGWTYLFQSLCLVFVRVASSRQSSSFFIWHKCTYNPSTSLMTQTNLFTLIYFLPQCGAHTMFKSPSNKWHPSETFILLWVNLFQEFKQLGNIMSTCWGCHLKSSVRETAKVPGKIAWKFGEFLAVPTFGFCKKSSAKYLAAN